jgi:hypothetical protein
MRSLLRPASVVIVLALGATLPVAAQVTLPIRMRAFAVNMSNNLTGANGIIQITLDRWSDGGERIVLATDRQMSFREITNNPRTTDYPFLLIQIHVKGDKGEGKMASFTQIRYDKKKNVMEIENYGTAGGQSSAS